MLVEKLKQISQDLEYTFNQGAGHWQNLNDFPDDAQLPFEKRVKYLLPLWVDRSFKLNDYGAIEGYEFEGEMILAVRSKVSDKDYNTKYDDHIAPLQQECLSLFHEFNSCEPWTVKRWKEIEVHNQYDTNVDGLKIKFTISYE